MCGAFKNNQLTSGIFTKVNAVMNMSETVGRLGRGLWRVNFSSHDRENLQESNVLPDDCFHDQKRDMTSSVT